MSAAVVSHGGADCLGHAVDPAHQVVERLVGELRRFLDRRVQIVDVRLMMLSWWISIVLASMCGSSASFAYGSAGSVKGIVFLLWGVVVAEFVAVVLSDRGTA